MSGKEYFPYVRRGDAIEEYRWLRHEVLNSQQQRLSFLQYSLILIGVLFGYLIRDGNLNPRDALMLTMLTVAPSLFSYSTRCREERITNYTCVFLRRMSPWSVLCSGDRPVLGFFQRSSTTIVFLMLLLNFVFLLASWPFGLLKDGLSAVSGSEGIVWVLVLLATGLNGLIAQRAAHLPNYKKDYGEALERLRKDGAVDQSSGVPAGNCATATATPQTLLVDRDR